MSAKYKSPSFLLPNELNTSSNPANDTGVNSLYSMDFDGSGYISVNPIVLTDFSVSFWINPSTITGASYDGILGQGTTAAQGGILRYVAYDGNTSTGSVILYLGSSWTNVASLTNGVWSNVILTYDSTADELKSYKNGSLDTTISSPDFSGQTTNAHSFVDIGRRNGSSGSIFNGQIDEVAIFNRALNTTEIAALYGGTSPNIYPSNIMATDLNPIAYYPLGEQAQNSGKLPDTSTNEWQFPNGVLQDYVMDFDGGDNIIVGKKFDFVQSTNVFTINLWIKSSNFNHNSNQVILGTNNTSSNNQVGFQLWNDDRGGGNGNQALNFNIFNGSSGTAIAVNTALTDNNWHMITVVGTGSSINMYKDGNTTPIGSSSSATTSTTAQSNLLIGTNILSSLGFIGKISNLAIWNTDQSTNVANIYNNGSPQTSYTVTPQNWWKLNADSVYTPSVASYSTALGFDRASSDYISFPDISFTGEFTVSFWMKLNLYGSVVIGDGVSSNWLRIHTSTQTDLDLANSKSSWQSGATFTTGEWQHVVLRRDSSNVCTIFRNGIHYTNNSPTKPGTFGPLNKIGQKNNGGYFDGQLSNIAIFNSSLTSSQVSTLFNFGTPETNISFNPIHWWKLDNTTTGIQDSGSASNNGTNNGATQATTSVAVVPSWKIPSALPITAPNYTKALDFVASQSDYIYLQDSTTNTFGFPNKTGSISAWIKIDDFSAERPIASKREIGNPGKRQWIFNIGTNGKVYFYAYNTDSNSDNTVSNSTLSTGQWYHITLTLTSTQTKIYINGSLDVTHSNTYSSIQNDQADLNIGRRGANADIRYFNGPMSNIAIYDSTLSASQVSTLYNNGTPETAISFSPIGWWKLDTGGSTITDYGSGGNNGTNNGAAQVTSDVLTTQPSNGVSTTLPSTALQQSDLQFDSPYSNYSLSFDGTGDYIRTSGFTIGNNYTFSCWLKSDTTTPNFMCFLSSPNYYTNNYNGNFVIRFTSSTQIQMYSYNGQADSESSTVTIPSIDNNWHHFSLTSNGTTTKIYWDGSPLTVTGNQTKSLDNISQGLIIGHNITGFNNAFNGKIDETSIFNYSLSEAQVLEIYNNGRPNDLSTFSGTAPISWWRLGENAYFDNNSFVVPNSITGAPNGTGFGTITTMISADAPGTYANGIGENLDILDRVGDAPLSTSNSQSYNMIPSDISPYVPGYVGDQIANNYSMEFDGVNDYITVPDSSDLQLVNTDFSISFWINPSAVGSYVFMKKYGSGTGWGIWLESGNLRFLAFPSGFQTVTTVSQNVWTHILIVGDNSGNNLLCYKNGAEVYNSSYTLSISSNTTDLEIGSAHGVNYFYKGLIDEVAIFDKALTADQVKFDLYKPSLPAGSNKTADFVNNPNLPNPVAWYRMGD